MVTDDTTGDRGNDSGHVGNSPQARVGRSPPMRDILPGERVRSLSVGVHCRSATHRSASVASTDYDAVDELLTGCALPIIMYCARHAAIVANFES